LFLLKINGAGKVFLSIYGVIHEIDLEEGIYPIFHPSTETIFHYQQKM
jgi:uncharacterized protein (AIM24 family)